MPRLFALTTLACLMATFIGCSGGDDYREVSDADLAPAEEHHHTHEAPHGGLLIEVGEHEYNAELVVAEDRNLTVYVLSAHAEAPVPAAADSAKLSLKNGEETIEVALKAVPQEGEAEGQASQFQSEQPLPEAIADTHDLSGSLTLNIAGKDYTVTVDGHAAHDHDHDHEGHDHDHEHGEEGDHDHDHEHEKE